jgi:hypothetical protein
MRSRRVIGSCFASEIQGWNVSHVLAECLQVSSAVGLRDKTSALVVSVGSTDVERVSACALVDTILGGYTATPGFFDLAPSELVLLTEYRTSTYCWPRFPLNDTDNRTYASCVKANVPTRLLTIKGSGFGDRQVRIFAHVGNATHRYPCKQPEVRRDSEIRCELQNATALPIGDLTAEIKASGSTEESAPGYYLVNSGNQSAPDGSKSAPVVIRSVCRLGTRYVDPKSPYFPVAAVAANATVDQICYGVEIVDTGGKPATWKFTDFSITDS